MQQNQSIVASAIAGGCRIVFAIPDHPWTGDDADAKVRIAMTVVCNRIAATRQLPELLLAPDHDQMRATHGQIPSEIGIGEFQRIIGREIPPDLSQSVDASALSELSCWQGLCHAGMKPYAASLIVSSETAKSILPTKAGFARHARRYRNGQDIARQPRDIRVLDFFGLTEVEIREQHPHAYQYLLTNTKKERSEERNPRLRAEWWLFEANRPELRRGIASIGRYIVTVENSPLRYFAFLDSDVLPDQKLRVVCCDDAFVLGVLSSTVHARFASRLGGRHGVANTPVYNSRCVTSFPFPVTTDTNCARIRALAEKVDAHRKRQQAAHPDLTITGMYNVLEKLRSGEVLTGKDKAIHEQGLVSVLKKLHDDLDAAVFDAYGWPHDLTDEQILERLVALNAERAAEEKRGLIRWLRPEFQNPQGGKPAKAATQEKFAATQEPEEAVEASVPTAAPTASAWPKKLPEQIAAIRDLVTRTHGNQDAWTVESVCAAFKGAKKTDVEEVLESLEALGLVTGYTHHATRRWKTAVA
jgi:hypothetical protein